MTACMTSWLLHIMSPTLCTAEDIHTAVNLLPVNKFSLFKWLVSTRSWEGDSTPIQKSCDAAAQLSKLSFLDLLRSISKVELLRCSFLYLFLQCQQYKVEYRAIHGIMCKVCQKPDRALSINKDTICNRDGLIFSQIFCGVTFIYSGVQ